MTSQVTQATGPLGALNATVGPVAMANCKPTVYLDAGLTGTIQLQARPSTGVGGWQPIIPVGATAANITAPGLYAFPPLGGDWQFQIACTAYTSGSANATLQIGPSL